MTDFFSKLPYYFTVHIRSKKYFLVHAGLDCRLRQKGEKLAATLKRQSQEHPKDMIWVRREFIMNKALSSYTIIFGHTPAKSIPGHRRSKIYHDRHWKDKIGIDCGCYGGGQLAALRLDDMQEFYAAYDFDEIDT